jgi:hypothetical protein
VIFCIETKTNRVLDKLTCSKSGSPKGPSFETERFESTYGQISVFG